MVRSLRGRLVVLLALVMAAAIAAGLLMLGLFQQSASAQVGRAEAEIGRACDAIESAYRFYTAGWNRPAPPLDDDGLRRDLVAVAQTALRDRPGVEGGVWQGEAGALAYAFPTYEGTGPKTDLPAAELPRIAAINQSALVDERQATSRYDAASQTLLLTSCPLPGLIAGLTAWTMARVYTFAGRGYQQLMAGLAVLLVSVLAAAVLLTRLTMTWSRHVGRIETALNAHEIAALPRLPPTGERELDRIVTALNDAGERLAEARGRADDMARQMAAGERLAAIGRVAAGVAHEIRNPIAAMRLKAENAVAGNAARKDLALSSILEQVGRLDALVRRLLSVTERDTPRHETVALGAYLDRIIAAHIDLADAKRLVFERRGDADLA
ncbi:MAG: HAMP domain-containing histidine kinase, partial [Proteobacteria bacterium]|nr:HAMP domain-containing histidine kinase [Pseudomonadota bacterium]